MVTSLSAFSINVWFLMRVSYYLAVGLLAFSLVIS